MTEADLDRLATLLAAKLAERTAPREAYSPVEAGRQLGVSAQTIRREVEAGKLRGTTIRGKLRIARADLLAYIEANHGPAPQPRNSAAAVALRERIIAGGRARGGKLN